MDPRYITISEYAKIHNLTRWAIYKRIARGSLKARKVRGIYQLLK